MDISFVIPTYGRPENLGPLAKDVIQKMDEINNLLLKKGKVTYTYEIIFIDDGGHQENQKVIETLAKTNSLVKGLILEENVGQQNASLAGIRIANGQMIVTLDDDFMHDLGVLDSMIRRIEAGVKVVYGAPIKRETRIYRQVGTWLKELLFFMMCNKPRHIRMTSYRIMSRDVVDYLVNDRSQKVYLSARILQYTRNMENIYYDCREEADSGYTFIRLVSLMVGIMKHYHPSFFRKKVETFDHRSKDQYVIKENFL